MTYQNLFTNQNQKDECCNSGLETNFVNLFEIFIKLHKVIEENMGVGLGISICKRIITKLGGKILVVSELEKGTAFYFNIPKKRIRRRVKK